MEQTGTGAMTLAIEGDPTDHPATAESISAALAKRPRGEDWYLTLEGDDGMVDATPGTAGRVHLAVEVGDAYVDAEVPDDDALVAAIFMSVLERDSRWRTLAQWREPAPPEYVKAPAGFPIQAQIGVGFVALLAVAAFLFDGRWVVILFALAFPGIILAAALVKMKEVKVAAGWKQGRATIVRSAVVGGKPDIAYDFSVGMDMVPFHGTRVSIGEIAVNDPEIPRIMKSYPAGASVPVFYDPANPRNSVLERGMPVSPKAMWILVGVMAVVMVGMVGVWWTLTS